MLYEVKQNEDIYDVTVKLYGSVSYCVKLCEDNDISLTDDIQHLTLVYDESVKSKVNVEFRLNSIPSTVNNAYFIKETQSIYDLALMMGYGIDGIVNFMNASGLTDLDNNNISGQEIFVTKIKTRLSQYVLLNNISFATGFTDSNFRLLESGDFRLLENGFYRLLE
jgi:hypothetical protein